MSRLGGGPAPESGTADGRITILGRFTAFSDGAPGWAVQPEGHGHHEHAGPVGGSGSGRDAAASRLAGITADPPGAALPPGATGWRPGRTSGRAASGSPSLFPAAPHDRPAPDRRRRRVGRPLTRRRADRRMAHRARRRFGRRPDGGPGSDQHRLRRRRPRRGRRAGQRPVVGRVDRDNRAGPPGPVRQRGRGRGDRHRPGRRRLHPDQRPRRERGDQHRGDRARRRHAPVGRGGGGGRVGRRRRHPRGRHRRTGGRRSRRRRPTFRSATAWSPSATPWPWRAA